MTQSIVITAIIWLFISCVSNQTTEEQVRFTHAVLLYLALTMIVSYSMLTIKTAALAWFAQGVFQRNGLDRETKGAAFQNSSFA